MLIADYFGEDKSAWRIRITATESSERALSEAERGVYANENLVLLPPKWVGRYFRPVSAYASAVADSIRADIRFANCPLHMNALPGSLPFDIVLCRNLLSGCSDRERLVRLLHAATADEGYLLIGPNETLSSRSSSAFHCELPSIYRKRGTERSADPFHSLERSPAK
jgi:chemotaxis protein methyltransferase CheR